jgi:hypothetical protein
MYPSSGECNPGCCTIDVLGLTRPCLDALLQCTAALTQRVKAEQIRGVNTTQQAGQMGNPANAGHACFQALQAIMSCAGTYACRRSKPFNFCALGMSWPLKTVVKGRYLGIPAVGALVKYGLAFVGGAQLPCVVLHAMIAALWTIILHLCRRQQQHTSARGACALDVCTRDIICPACAGWTQSAIRPHRGPGPALLLHKLLLFADWLHQGLQVEAPLVVLG